MATLNLPALPAPIKPAQDEVLVLTNADLRESANVTCWPTQLKYEQLLEQALKKHGSTRKVAKALKINQSTVVRKLKKFGLDALCPDLDEPGNPFENLTFRM